MDVGRCNEVGAADDMRHPHIGVVERAREMIARGRVLAREDDIAVRRRIGGPKPLPRLFPLQIAAFGKRTRGVEAPAMRFIREAACPLDFGQAPAGAGVDRAGWPMRCRQAGGDIGAGAEAGIDEPARAQIVERGGIGAEPRRLAHRIAVPVDPEPGEVGERGADIILARSAAVDIVDADQELPARAARRVMREHRAIGVAEVELAGRAGGEAGQHAAPLGSRYCASAPPDIPYLAAHRLLTCESYA